MIDTTPKVTGIDASYYYASDLQRATKFYTDLLGMEPTMTYEGMVSEWTFPGGETFGLYKPHEEGPIDTSHGVMFAVPDIESATSQHKARGVKFEAEVSDTPACRMSFGEDTEGNTFILHQRK
ncbi:MAG: VOC family protein [Candidatus Eremiobacteraeota bacterium]|nr:VOC family protein [Candidatus Eremiobacteraeota bacterium]